jgi:hypothetical protein
MITNTVRQQPPERGHKPVPRWLAQMLAVHWLKRLPFSWRACVPLAMAIVLVWNWAAVAQTAAPDPVKMAQELKVGLDTIWVMIAGMLVIFMNAGCLILWLGWFGFNPGSTMSVGNGAAIAHIALTTNTAGAFGGITATIVAWLMLGKPDLSMVINGILAGLVAVTAPCAFITLPAAAIIGTVAGVLVDFAVGFFDQLQIDDPVGAVSVASVNSGFRSSACWRSW